MIILTNPRLELIQLRRLGIHLGNIRILLIE